MSMAEDEEITATFTKSLGKELATVSPTTEQGLLIQTKKDEKMSKEDFTLDQFIVDAYGLISLNDKK